MANRTKDKPSTSQQPPLQTDSQNIISFGLVITSQAEFNSSSFSEFVRSILEQDRNTSPFTPEQNTQTLAESRRILTRAYAHQLGLTPIDYSLPRH